MRSPLQQSQSIHAAQRARAGFTLMETILAMVLGAMVLLGSSGVFFALRNMERTFADKYQRTSELDVTHTIITRAMLNIQMDETQTNQIVRASDEQAEGTDEIEELEPEPRYRLILETDPSTAPDSTGWIPQRFEMVNATPPVPSGLATSAAGWYVAQDQNGTLDFSAMDGSQGTVRGVFEMRPTGQREIIMQRLGLVSTNDTILTQVNDANITLDVAHLAPNWTLWWRPILNFEARQLLYGQGPYGDTMGTADEIRARLAGAVPLLRNIKQCTWEVFKGDEYISTHYGRDMGDLPAYTQIEILLTNGQYASWMFEVDWVIGTDPSTESTDADPDDTNDDDSPTDTGNPPGTNGGPNPTRVINIGDS